MRCAVGVDLGGTSIKAGLVSPEGAILERAQVATASDSGAESVAAQVAGLVRDISVRGGQRGEIVGVGLGSPGLVRADEGLVLVTPNLRDALGNPWRDVPLVLLLSRELGDLGLPVFLENDVNAMALAEHRFGAGSGSRIMVGMTLGTGVGGGIVIDGRVFRGASETAGEIGHITVVPDGPPCGCGNRGCLEAIVGTVGLLSRTQEAVRAAGEASALHDRLDDLTPRMIADAAKDGDSVAKEMFAGTGRAIGIVLAGVANFVNPDAVVIGGGIAAAGEQLLFRHIRVEVRKRAIEVPTESMRVVAAELGNDAGMVGAATVALTAAGALPARD